ARELSPPAGAAKEKPPAPSGPRSLRPFNQIWGSLHVTLTDKETDASVKARCYLTDAADHSWSPSGALTYVKPLEQHFIASGEFQISLPGGNYTLRIERGAEYRPVTRT